jgi:hypothetical protein
MKLVKERRVGYEISYKAHNLLLLIATIQADYIDEEIMFEIVDYPDAECYIIKFYIKEKYNVSKRA